MSPAKAAAKDAVKGAAKDAVKGAAPERFRGFPDPHALRLPLPDEAALGSPHLVTHLVTPAGRRRLSPGTHQEPDFRAQ